MTYFRDKKQTVEKCLCLDMKFVDREAYLKAWFATEQVSWFSDFYQQELYRVELEIIHDGKKQKGLSISHFDLKADKIVYDQTVKFKSMKLASGGERWYFLCPGKGCGKRVNILYLPPGERDFACRDCHDLTYKSCQENIRKPVLLQEVGRIRVIQSEVVKAVNRFYRRNG